MKQPETLFKEKARRDLEKLGAIWICKTQQVSLRGTPDFLICLSGWFVAIELKKDSAAKTSTLQTFNLNKIREAGGLAFIAYPDNWASVLKELNEVKKWRVIVDHDDIGI